MFKFTRPSPIAALLGALFTALIAIAAAVIFSFQPYVVAPTQDPSPLPASPASGVCADQAGEQLQTCCEAWADDTELVRPLCVGNWVLEDDRCAWECESSPVAE